MWYIVMYIVSVNQCVYVVKKSRQMQMCNFYFEGQRYQFLV